MRGYPISAVRPPVTLTEEEAREVAWFIEHFALDKDLRRSPALATALSKLKGEHAHG